MTFEEYNERLEAAQNHVDWLRAQFERVAAKNTQGLPASIANFEVLKQDSRGGWKTERAWSNSEALFATLLVSLAGLGIIGIVATLAYAFFGG